MVEVECARDNTNFFFRPLQRALRGRFDMSKVPEPMAKIDAAANWPLPIPGQRIGIDRGGVGYVVEPLHEPAHAAMKEKVEKRGARLEPPLVAFESIDKPTWHFWLKNAVDSGLCRIVSGSLPDKIEGTPEKNFIMANPGPTSGDKLSAALDRQTAAFEGLTAALTKLLEARK